jgi:hypothetical protein
MCKTSLLNPGASEIALKFQEFTPFLATNKMLTILQLAMVTLRFLKHRKTTVLKENPGQVQLQIITIMVRFCFQNLSQDS